MSQLDAVVIVPASTAASVRALSRARANGTLTGEDGQLMIEGEPVVLSAESVRALQAAEERRQRRARKRAR